MKKKITKAEAAEVANKALETLKEGMSKLNEEKGVCERCVEGTEVWTDVDCEYLIEGVDKVEAGLRDLTTALGVLMGIETKQ